MLEVCVDSVARAVSAEADVARATQLIASILEEGQCHHDYKKTSCRTFLDE